jgi:hypothetical protein
MSLVLLAATLALCVLELALANDLPGCPLSLLYERLDAINL